jgi:membrane protein DedA with SNARE-associated domain
MRHLSRLLFPLLFLLLVLPACSGAATPSSPPAVSLVVFAGATITFAGNFPGITQTLSIAVYLAAQDDLDTAVALSVLLLAVSFGVLLVVQFGRRKQGVGAETRGG